MEDDPRYVRAAFAARGERLRPQGGGRQRARRRDPRGRSRRPLRAPGAGARLIEAEVSRGAQGGGGSALGARARDPPAARARPHEPGDRQAALHLGPHGRDAPRSHHAEAPALDPGRARELRARERVARAELSARGPRAPRCGLPRRGVGFSPMCGGLGGAYVRGEQPKEEAMAVRVAINGFGRTGRAAFRAAFEREADIEWVAINDVAEPAMLAQLLKHDTVYGPFGRTRRGRRRRARRRRRPDRDSVRDRPGEAAVGRARRRRRDRVDRPLPRTRRRAQAPRGRRGAGDRVGAREGSGRDRRARRQLRRRLRPRQAPDRLERVVHDELPRPGGEAAPRGLRHPARPDDDRARLHRRPVPAGRAAQGLPARPRRRVQPRADDDRRREGARARRARARGQAPRLRGPRARPDRLAGRPHGRGRAADVGGGGERAVPRAAPTPARSRASSPTARSRSSRPTSSSRRTRRSSTPASPP